MTWVPAHRVPGERWGVFGYQRWDRGADVRAKEELKGGGEALATVATPTEFIH